MQQREKQIQFGKATLGYQLYIAAVPRRNRRKYEHPNTPDAKQVCSKRSWDGQVRVWRRALHFWDPNSKEGAAEEANQEGNDAGAGDAAAVEIDLAGSDLGGFYEADDQDDQQASSAASSAPFPPVVQVHFEPMDFGNGQDSLLGKWTANSNRCVAIGAFASVILIVNFAPCVRAALVAKAWSLPASRATRMRCVKRARSHSCLCRTSSMTNESMTTSRVNALVLQQRLARAQAMTIRFCLLLKPSLTAKWSSWAARKSPLSTSLAINDRTRDGATAVMAVRCSTDRLG